MLDADAIKVHALRLRPGEDLRGALEAWAGRENPTGAFVLSAVGSLQQAAIRFAGAHAPEQRQGPFEIIAVSGTLAPDATGWRAHLHTLLADAGGRPLAGHVCAGCGVASTVELVLGEARHLRFRREVDPDTGYPELVVD